jgi:hypothetical protein
MTGKSLVQDKIFYLGIDRKEKVFKRMIKWMLSLVKKDLI